MPKDLMFILPYRADMLAQLATALGKAGISIAGCTGKEFGPEEIVHLLVDDAAGARRAAEQAGFVVRVYLATTSRVVIGVVEDLERAQAALRPAGR
jgi:hypothetical protein